MKKIFLLLLMIFTLGGCGQDSDVNRKIFVIGIDDEFAPMTFRDEKNQIVGFDIDMAKATAERMGVTFNFKPINWDNKETEINSGNIDMIWSGFDITDERKEQLLFGKPYMDDRQILLVRTDSLDEIKSVNDLAGKVVGTQAGTSSESFINKNESVKNSFMKFRTYTNFKEGFEYLSRREVDALIVDEIAGRYEANRNPDVFKVVDVTIGPVTEFAIGFRKNDVELRDKVQAAFDKVVEDGTAKQISERWFNVNLIKNDR